MLVGSNISCDKDPKSKLYVKQRDTIIALENNNINNNNNNLATKKISPFSQCKTK